MISRYRRWRAELARVTPEEWQAAMRAHRKILRGWRAVQRLEWRKWKQAFPQLMDWLIYKILK